MISTVYLVKLILEGREKNNAVTAGIRLTISRWSTGTEIVTQEDPSSQTTKTREQTNYSTTVRQQPQHKHGHTGTHNTQKAWQCFCLDV
jgi:hypothetical protein